MTVRTEPGKDLIWITRIHPRNAATLGIFVEGRQVGTRVIPAIPGQWLEIATLVPGNVITSAQTRIRVEANIVDPAVGHYMPYYHWFYQGDYHPDITVTLPGPGATFGQSILLVGRNLAYNPGTRTARIDVEWQIKDGADRFRLDADLVWREHKWNSGSHKEWRGRSHFQHEPRAWNRYVDDKRRNV